MPKDTFIRLSEEKKERILRAAISEFNKTGFERTTVDDIAERANIAKGSVYQYFEDKRELFLYCAQWGLSTFMAKLESLMPLAELDVFDYFRDAAAKSAVIAEERELTVFMQQLAREPDLADEGIRRMYASSDNYISTLIANSVKRGTVRSDIDQELIKEYFIGVTDRMKQRWMRLYFDFTRENYVDKGEQLAAEVEQMIHLLKQGMGC